MQKITTRTAEISDAEKIACLNARALGYEFGIEKTRDVLSEILGDAKNAVFIAEYCGEFAGYIHACTYVTTFSPLASNIMGIAVAENFRRKGIGRALLQAAEEWTRVIGGKSVRLCSGMERKEAHEFYASCGYARVKEQMQFRKTM